MRCETLPKSFYEMTADEMRAYKGPIFSYSVVFVNDKGQKSAHDGDCTTVEKAHAHAQEIINHYTSRGWRLDHEPRFYDSTNKTDTVDLSETELDALLTSDKVVEGVIRALNAAPSQEIKELVAECLRQPSKPVAVAGGFVVDLVVVDE